MVRPVTRSMHKGISTDVLCIGDIFYLNAAGQPIIVINRRDIAVELLDRRASIYSDRPPNIVGCDIMAGGLLLGFARYGDMY